MEAITIAKVAGLTSSGIFAGKNFCSFLINRSPPHCHLMVLTNPTTTTTILLVISPTDSYSEQKCRIHMVFVPCGGPGDPLCPWGSIDGQTVA